MRRELASASVATAIALLKLPTALGSSMGSRLEQVFKKFRKEITCNKAVLMVSDANCEAYGPRWCCEAYFVTCCVVKRVSCVVKMQPRCNKLHLPRHGCLSMRSAFAPKPWHYISVLLEDGYAFTL